MVHHHIHIRTLNDFAVETRQSDFAVETRQSDFAVEARQSDFAVEIRQSDFAVEIRQSHVVVTATIPVGTGIRRHLDARTMTTGLVTGTDLPLRIDAGDFIIFGICLLQGTCKTTELFWAPKPRSQTLKSENAI